MPTDEEIRHAVVPPRNFFFDVKLVFKFAFLRLLLIHRVPDPSPTPLPPPAGL